MTQGLQQIQADSSSSNVAYFIYYDLVKKIGIYTFQNSKYKKFFLL